MDAHWVSAIAESVLAFTVIVAWLQLRADHERSRRERACELLRYWSESTIKSGATCKRFVETLNIEDSRRLLAREVFDIDKKQKRLADECLTSLGPVADAGGGAFKLTSEQVVELRWQAVSYLNRLESVLGPWLHHVADRKIIESEFQFVFESGRLLMPHFLEACGEDYPAIKSFARGLEATPNRTKVA